MTADDLIKRILAQRDWRNEQNEMTQDFVGHFLDASEMSEDWLVIDLTPHSTVMRTDQFSNRRVEITGN